MEKEGEENYLANYKSLNAYSIYPLFESKGIQHSEKEKAKLGPVLF